MLYSSLDASILIIVASIIIVSAFNAHRGFPFEVRLPENMVEPFRTEDEAANFSDHLAVRMIEDAR